MPATKHGKKVSEEATAKGLRLAREAGDAFRHMVEYFIENVAVSGAMRREDDYLIGVAVEEAGPLCRILGGEIEVNDPPPSANAHLEVVVMDADDGRFLPHLVVHATLVGPGGGELGTFRLPFLWHPTMFHYGTNLEAPVPGEYRVKVYIEPPTFPRHDAVNGRRYTRPATVEFEGIRMEPGRS